MFFDKNFGVFFIEENITSNTRIKFDFQNIFHKIQ